MQELTNIQRQILRFIEEESALRGAPPTLRRIRDAFGFKAISTVQGHVAALLQKGFLEKEDGQARGLRLPARHHAPQVSIPLLGTVPAGPPREATELIQGAVAIPEKLARKGTLFALKISGDSMMNAGIQAGDIAIVRKQNHFQHGDIVVALVEGEVTLKRFQQEGDRAWLVAENPKYAPIALRSEKDMLQGKVISVQRYYES